MGGIVWEGEELEVDSWKVELGDEDVGWTISISAQSDIGLGKTRLWYCGYEDLKWAW